jgi:hypothetical protein
LDFGSEEFDRFDLFLPAHPPIKTSFISMFVLCVRTLYSRVFFFFFYLSSRSFSFSFFLLTHKSNQVIGEKKKTERTALIGSIQNTPSKQKKTLSFYIKEYKMKKKYNVTNKYFVVYSTIFFVCVLYR